MHFLLLIIALALTYAQPAEGQPPTDLGVIRSFGIGWDYPADVEVRDNLAYVATSYGLRIIDVSNPRNPYEIGYFYEEGADFATCVQLLGDRCIAVVSSGLSILDISDPVDPMQIGHCAFSTRDEKTGLAVQGNFAYVSILYSGLIILDISNPEDPDSVGFIETSDLAFDVAVAGDIAYVATYRRGITVLDISDPTNPEQIALYDTPDAARRVALDGELLYVADLDAGLRVIDVSDPANPNEIAGFDTRGRSCGISIRDGIAAVSDFDAIELFNIEERDQLRSIGRFSGHDNSRNIYLSGPFAYYLSDDYGLVVVDLNDLPRMRRDGMCHTQGVPHEFIIANGLVYTAYGDAGFRILQTDNPWNEIGSWTSAREVNSIGLVGNNAFVTDRRRGLLALDCSDPSDPVLLGELEFNGIPSNLSVAAEFGIVVEDESILKIIDISDPGNLNFVTSSQMDGVINDVAIRGEMAIVAIRDEGVRLFDLSQQDEITELSRCSTPGNANAICFFDNIAIIADGDSGITAIELSNPMEPQIAWRYENPSYVIDLCVSDTSLYLIDSLGLRKLSPIDETISEVAFCETPDCKAISASNDKVVASDWRTLTLYGYIPGWGIEVKESFAPSFLSLSVFPNPFNSSTTLDYSLPRPGRYAIDVIDIQGRLVTRLDGGWKEAGSYREVLNGGSLTSGQYMLKLVGTNSSLATPVTIIK